MAETTKDGSFPRIAGLVPLINLCIVLLTLLLIPLTILSTGYVPFDDVLSNVALAISGKSWDDVMLLRQGVSLTLHSPGWDTLLRVLFLGTGFEPGIMVGIAVFGMMTVFLVSGLTIVKHYETWLLALLLVFVIEPNFLVRITLGRPFILTSAVLILLLALWMEELTPVGDKIKYVVSILGVALSVWIHGSWYLFALPVMTFFLAGRFLDGFKLGICCVFGTLLGGLFTGHPLEFVSHHVRHFGMVFGVLPRKLMVGELQAYRLVPGIPALIAAGIGWLWIRHRNWRVLLNPVFILMVTGLIMGFFVARFWLDWGIPALLVWLARMFDEEIQKRNIMGLLRIPVTVGLGIVLVFICMADTHQRWTGRIQLLATAEKGKTDPSWTIGLPRGDGIVYSGSMYAFDLLFYRYPQKPWRYAVGSEPAIMREEDLPVFIWIQKEGYNTDTIRPWVNRMRPNDRLVLVSEQQPCLPDLEWCYIGTGLWSGRHSTRGN